MIDIVVPMAGHGSRFIATPEVEPKPMILVTPGKRMIEYVIDYLTLDEPHRFIFVCLAEHVRDFGLIPFFGRLTQRFEVVTTDAVTRGPAASALLAAGHIDGDNELLIAYCDSFLAIDMADVIAFSRLRRADGTLIAYPSAGPLEGHIEVDPSGRVARAVEKQQISALATTGTYYFRRGRDFVAGARSMIAKLPAGAEPFVGPVYNELIAQGKTILPYAIDRAAKVEMGTPDELGEARRRLEGDRRALGLVG